MTVRRFLLCLALGAPLGFAAHPADRVSAAAASVTLQSGVYATRTTIPVTINGYRVSCVLDTGTSAMLVSPAVAQAAGLPSRSGTFELAPDGHTYVDRRTQIARFAAGGYTLSDLPALISSNLGGSAALCGYDFFAHFPTFIDRDRRTVTLFPSPARLQRTHCLPVDLGPRVPLATIEINGTWLDHIVLDSGMAGGGALWDGVRTQLQRPLVTSADYETLPGAIARGFSCGAIASVRFGSAVPDASMPICTEPQRPDGYNGIIETNLSSIHAMAVDYPQHRICFNVGAPAIVAARYAPPQAPSDAWSRFNELRPP